MNKSNVSVCAARAIACLTVAVFLHSGAGCLAKDAPNPELHELLNGLLSGVQCVKKTDAGHVKSLVVIGRAPLSRSLPRARAELQALKVARANAKAQFVSYLKTKARYEYDQADGSVVLIDGAASGDDGPASSSEQGSTWEDISETTHLVADDFVVALQEIGATIDESGKAAIAYGWSLDNVKGVSTIREAQAEATRPVSAKKSAGPSTAPSSNGPTAPSPPAGPNKAPDPGTSISPDAGDYMK